MNIGERSNEKNAMDNSFFEKSMQNLQYAFRFTGLIMRNKNVKLNEKIIYRLWFLFDIICLDSAILGELLFIYESAIARKGFMALTDVPLVTICLLGQFKATSHLIYENHINKLIEDLKSLEKIKKNDRTIADNTEDVVKAKIYKKETVFLEIIVKAFNIVITVSLTIYVLIPIIRSAHKYYKTEEIELLMPFLIVYPFDSNKVKYYPWIIIHQILSVSQLENGWSDLANFGIELFVEVRRRFKGGTCLKFIASSDGLFYTCCTYIRIQFKLLQYDFEHLISPQNFSHSLSDDASLGHKFKDLVIRHQKLTQCSELLELVYRKAMLLNFVMSSLILIGLSGFVVIISDDLQVTVSFAAFFVLSTYQIFFVCLFGDMVKNSSMDLTNALYNCRWYHTDSTFRKKILMVQMRAQKPCKVTAYGFADVNLTAFSAILGKSWSVFAVLKTMYK